MPRASKSSELKIDYHETEQQNNERLSMQENAAQKNRHLSIYQCKNTSLRSCEIAWAFLGLSIQETKEIM